MDITIQKVQYWGDQIHEFSILRNFLNSGASSCNRKFGISRISRISKNVYAIVDLNQVTTYYYFVFDSKSNNYNTKSAIRNYLNENIEIDNMHYIDNYQSPIDIIKTIFTFPEITNDTVYYVNETSNVIIEKKLVSVNDYISILRNGKLKIRFSDYFKLWFRKPTETDINRTKIDACLVRIESLEVQLAYEKRKLQELVSKTKQ